MRGYFGKAESENDSSHNTNMDPRADCTSRACRQSAHKPPPERSVAKDAIMRASYSIAGRRRQKEAAARNRRYDQIRDGAVPAAFF